MRKWREREGVGERKLMIWKNWSEADREMEQGVGTPENFCFRVS